MLQTKARQSQHPSTCPLVTPRVPPTPPRDHAEVDFPGYFYRSAFRFPLELSTTFLCSASIGLCFELPHKCFRIGSLRYCKCPCRDQACRNFRTASNLLLLAPCHCALSHQALSLTPLSLKWRLPDTKCQPRSNYLPPPCFRFHEKAVPKVMFQVPTVDLIELVSRWSTRPFPAHSFRPPCAKGFQNPPNGLQVFVGVSFESQTREHPKTSCVGLQFTWSAPEKKRLPGFPT